MTDPIVRPDGPLARALSKLWKRVRDPLIPLLFGVSSFFAVTGGRVAMPRNIAWLAKGDPATYFLSWHFFRNTPWGFPLGVNPRYGAEIGSAIALADNIPLLALACKAIQRWLPAVFQYFGLWILACFVLQAWFAWLLMGLLTRARFVRACGTALFVFAPPFVSRLEGHYALSGQWLVLAALYLCLGPRRLARGVAWPVLAFTVGLVHPYLTAMVLGLWFSDWLRRMIFERRRLADLAQGLLVFSGALLGLWQAGMFTIKNLGKSGFGQYRMNLASLFDPSGWSYFLPDLPKKTADYEGYAFLGLGGIWLSLLALPRLRRLLGALRARRQYWPLLAVFFGFTAFAISNSIGVADHNWVIPLPQSWVDRANLLRASGRMFWPVYYALLFLLLRAACKRPGPRSAPIILCLAALFQVIDTSAGWRTLRRAMDITGSSWDSPLRAPFWSNVPNLYRVIRMVPLRNQPPHYADFAYFAAMHGMSTDAVYLARVDQEKLERARLELSKALATGEFSRDTLYILDAASAKAARKTVNRRVDLFQWVDGFWVLAPFWRCRTECEGPRPQRDCSKRCRAP